MIENLSRDELELCLHKQCSRCGKVKFIAHFAKRTSRGKKGYQPKCRECVSVINKEQQKKNPRCKIKKAVYDAKRGSANRSPWERFKENCKSRSTPVVGTEDEFNFHKAKKTCDSCGLAFGDGNSRQVIDHCHETGKMRGALCNGCNAAEGYAGGIEGLKKLISYLEQTK